MGGGLLVALCWQDTHSGAVKREPLTGDRSLNVQWHEGAFGFDCIEANVETQNITSCWQYQYFAD